MIDNIQLTENAPNDHFHNKFREQAAQDALWHWDIDTDHIWWNEGFQRMFGYEAGQIKPSSENWYRSVHPDDLGRVTHSLNEAIAQGQSEWAEEYRFRRADGTYAHVMDRGFTIIMDGKPVRMIGSIADVSDRLLLEQAIQESESWRRIALDAAEMGTWTYDPATGNEVWDKRCREIFGVKQGPEDGKPYSTFGHVYPDDLSGLRSRVEEALDPAHRGIYNSEHRIIDATTGKIKWVRSRGKAFFTSQGVPYRFAGALMDITEEKRREELLTNFERRFQVGFDNALLGVVIANLEGRLILVNEAFSTMLGYTPGELYEGTFEPITHADDVEQSRALMRELIDGEASSFRLEKRYIHKDGHVVWACLHSTLIRDEEGERESFFSIVQDITSEKKLREEQQKLLTLVENSVELMSVLEMDGKNSYLNRAGRQMLGFDTLEQVQTTPVENLHTPEDFVQVREEVLPAVMNHGRWSGKMLVRHLKTGDVFPVFNNAIRIDDLRTGAPLAVGAVMRDLRPEEAAQAALVESEERFRNLIEQAPVAIGLLRGGDLVVEMANEHILGLWGKKNDVIGLPLLRALPEIEGQGFIERLQKVMTTGIADYGYEVPALLYRNGRMEEGFFNFVYAPVQDKGVTNGVAMIATEVTQQVKAMLDFQESEERFRNLIINAPVATAIYQGEDMVIQLANDAMIRLWGKNKAVIGQKLEAALPELEGQPFMKLLTNVYHTGQDYHATEGRADLMVDGKLQTFYFNFSYKPLRDAQGKVYAILNMAVDVTRQVIARQELAEAEESHREAVELAELGTWTIYPLTGRVECSQRVKEWIGVTSEVVTMEEISMSTHEKDRERIRQISEREFSPEGSGKINVEYTVVNRLTGQERIMHTQARAYLTADGQVHMIRGTSLDITAQRLNQQELERQVEIRTEQLQKSNTYLLQTNQELEQYAYVASHDLQEPLRKILIFSGMLMSSGDIADRNQEVLNKIIQSAERMSLLIKDLLEYSRLLKSTVRVVPVNLGEILDKVITDFELAIEEKKAQVVVGPLPALEGIPLQINQLFYNLLNNALKFSQEGVEPVIRVESRELTAEEVRKYHFKNSDISYYDISFSDNGIGFNAQYADRIFELFKRLHTRNTYPGSGIGLALCRRIVQNHQGFLYADSTEQQGTTFHIILPSRQVED